MAATRSRHGRSGTPRRSRSPSTSRAPSGRPVAGWANVEWDARSGAVSEGEVRGVFAVGGDDLMHPGEHAAAVDRTPQHLICFAPAGAGGRGPISPGGGRVMFYHLPMSRRRARSDVPCPRRHPLANPRTLRARPRGAAVSQGVCSGAMTVPVNARHPVLVSHGSGPGLQYQLCAMHHLIDLPVPQLSR